MNTTSQEEKKVLILSKEDNCQSIIAQAVLTKYLRSVTSYSAGVNLAKQIDANAVKLLKENGLFNNQAPTLLSSLENLHFDLVIVLEETLMNKIPDFLENADIISIEYETPNPQKFSEYKTLLKNIQMEITPIVRMHFEA
ncbi:MAG: arsenate reductase ArsC [Campylobacterales bacterium]|nr:arsenate reductase ArsC [Campylobacterales bacterium]